MRGLVAKARGGPWSQGGGHGDAFRNFGFRMRLTQLLHVSSMDAALRAQHVCCDGVPCSLYR